MEFITENVCVWLYFGIVGGDGGGVGRDDEENIF